MGLLASALVSDHGSTADTLALLDQWRRAGKQRGSGELLAPAAERGNAVIDYVSHADAPGWLAAWSIDCAEGAHCARNAEDEVA